MMSKRILARLVIFFLLLFFAVRPVFAQFGLGETARGARYQETNIYSVLGTAVSVFLSVLGLIFLIIIFYAGLRWMTARGKDEYIDRAKNALEAGVTGFIIVTLAYGLAYFIFNRLAQ